MIARCVEHGGCFEVCLTAETLKEAATLTRMARSATKEMRHASTTAFEGEFMTQFIFGKRRQPRNQINIGEKK